MGVLDETQWYLVSLDGKATLAGTLISALFSVNPDGASGSLNGTSGCNTYYATFGGGLGVQTTMTSYQSCPSPAGVNEQEQFYMQALSQTVGYELTTEMLTLRSGLGDLVYKMTAPGREEQIVLENNSVSGIMPAVGPLYRPAPS